MYVSMATPRVGLLKQSSKSFIHDFGWIQRPDSDYHV